jgi:hypothetical protein
MSCGCIYIDSSCRNCSTQSVEFNFKNGNVISCRIMD